MLSGTLEILDESAKKPKKPLTHTQDNVMLCDIYQNKEICQRNVEH